MGSKVAGIVKMLAVVVWVLGALGGVVVGASGVAGVNGALGIIVVLGIWLSAFLSGVFYYAYGELLENVAEIRESTSRQLEIGAQQIAAISRLLAGAAPAGDGPRFPGEQRRAGHVIDGATDSPVATRSGPFVILTDADFRTVEGGSTLITCPACGLEQPAARKRCWHCAVDFRTTAHSNDGTGSN